MSRHSTSYCSLAVRRWCRRSSWTMRVRGSSCPPPAKRRSGSMPLVCQSMTARSRSTTQICPGRGSADAEAGDQKARAMWLPQHVERGADQQPFRTAIRGIHQETAIRNDFKAPPTTTQHHLAVRSLTTLDHLSHPVYTDHLLLAGGYPEPLIHSLVSGSGHGITGRPVQPYK